jgi:hypothetical protein
MKSDGATGRREERRNGKSDKRMGGRGRGLM